MRIDPFTLLRAQHPVRQTEGGLALAIRVERKDPWRLGATR
jgi:hypothetical protein